MSLVPFLLVDENGFTKKNIKTDSRNIGEIAEILSHSCEEITEIYSHAFLAKISWKQHIY